MVLLSSMVDYRMSFPPIELQDHPTKALGKGMGQTIQSIDPLCEEVFSVFDLWGQSRVFSKDVMALIFFSILTYSFAKFTIETIETIETIRSFLARSKRVYFLIASPVMRRQNLQSYAQYGLPHSLFRCT